MVNQNSESEHNTEAGTQEEVEQVGEIETVPQLETRRVAPPRLRAAIWIAKAIMVLFGAIAILLVITICICVFIGKSHDPILDMAKVILPYLATPLGAAVGYFFAMRES